MRHGQGPIPPKRNTPSTTPRTATFDARRASPPGRAPNGGAPKPRRAWEDLRDAGMPNVSRSNTTRAPPKRHGFAPATPDGDEGQARSAYFNVKNERPKTWSDMPPPPPRAPTSKRTSPPRSYKDSLDPNLSHTGPTYSGHAAGSPFSNQGLHRSTTTAGPRESHGRSPGPPKSPLNTNEDHHRAASAGTSHRQEAFGRPNGVSTSTSETSSDDDLPDNVFQREQQMPTSRKPRMPAGTGIRHKTGFSPHVKIGSVEDEGQAARPLYAGTRRHSGIDLTSHNSRNDQPEGFQAHRMKHDPTKAGPQSASAPTAATAEPFIQRHKSFDDNYRSPGGGARTDKHQTPMYDPLGNSPFSTLLYNGPLPSEQWSRQWPFGPLRSPYAEPPPLWAIPSSVRPIAEHKVQNDAYLRSELSISAQSKPGANYVFNSFRWSDNEQAFTPTPPQRNKGTDPVQINFSPSSTPPVFGADNPFLPRRPSRQGRDDTSTQSSSQGEDEATKPGQDIPPPPKVGEKWCSEDWEKRFGTHTFELPASGPGSRASSRKRSGTPRTGSLNNLKRAATSRPGTFQPSVVDTADEPPAFDPSTHDNLNNSTSSRVSAGSDNAMDIDSTPPADAESRPRRTDAESRPRRTDAESRPRGTSDATPLTEPVNRTPTPRGPALPPRKPTPSQKDENFPRLNLGDFQHVAPFAPAQEGLGGVDDLKTALPFESRPSTSRPNFEHCSKQPDYPRVPRAPKPPFNLTQSTWERYMSDMNNYMFNWNSFNNQMLLIFQRRQEQHREIGPSWVGQMGGDVGAYLEGLEVDERMRKFWEVACDHHKECMTNLGEVRGKMLRVHGGA